MTTYILAGGSDERYPEYITSLASAVEAKVQRARILGVYFSMSEEDGDRMFPLLRDYLLPHFSTGTSYERAQPEEFISQVRASDVIYFHGGSTMMLMQAMERYRDIKQEFEGKIIIGSSAGANYLSKYCWSPTKGVVVEGSGILDIAIINHYQSSGFEGHSFEPEFWEEALRAVREASGKKEIVLLPEGTFVVIDQ